MGCKTCSFSSTSWWASGAISGPSLALWDVLVFFLAHCTWLSHFFFFSIIRCLRCSPLALASRAGLYQMLPAHLRDACQLQLTCPPSQVISSKTSNKLIRIDLLFMRSHWLFLMNPAFSSLSFPLKISFQINTLLPVNAQLILSLCLHIPNMH